MIISLRFIIIFVIIFIKLQKVHEAFRTRRKGITFEMFRSFHHILFGARDMKRTIEFMDPDKLGITR